MIINDEVLENTQKWVHGTAREPERQAMQNLLDTVAHWKAKAEAYEREMKGGQAINHEVKEFWKGDGWKERPGGIK